MVPWLLVSRTNGGDAGRSLDDGELTRAVGDEDDVRHHDLLRLEDVDSFGGVVGALEHLAQSEGDGNPLGDGLPASRRRARRRRTPSAFIPVTTPTKPGQATLAKGIAPSSRTRKTTLSRSSRSSTSKSKARATRVCPFAVASPSKAKVVHPMSGECSSGKRDVVERVEEDHPLIGRHTVGEWVRLQRQRHGRDLAAARVGDPAIDVHEAKAAVVLDARSRDPPRHVAFELDPQLGLLREHSVVKPARVGRADGFRGAFQVPRARARRWSPRGAAHRGWHGDERGRTAVPSSIATCGERKDAHQREHRQERATMSSCPAPEACAHGSQRAFMSPRGAARTLCARRSRRCGSDRARDGSGSPDARMGRRPRRPGPRRPASRAASARRTISPSKANPPERAESASVSTTG